MKIDIPREYLTRAIEATIASLKRSNTKQHNQLMKDIIQKDINIYTTALNTMTEK